MGYVVFLGGNDLDLGDTRIGWFRLSVSHKLQDRKFVKEYPEKYIGVCVSVQEWNVDE